MFLRLSAGYQKLDIPCWAGGNIISQMRRVTAQNPVTPLTHLQRPNIMDKFCLRWSEFESNIRDSFRELRVEQDFFDVTLVCDDGEQIEAHKIVLSAGSQFFRDILRKAKHPSSFIYLKGINRYDLKYLLDFLYNGEVEIGQEELNNFLKTAKALKVKGL